MSDETSTKKRHITITALFALTVLFAIGFSIYRYYFIQDFHYYVEVACDPKTEECGLRDCENNPDSCPPNMLSNYKGYYINAYDFPKCQDGSCEKACKEGMISCEPAE